MSTILGENIDDKLDRSADQNSDTDFTFPEPPPRLGDMIVDDGLATRDDVEIAASEANEKKLKIGAVLIARGIVGESDLYCILADQQNLPFMTYEAAIEQCDGVSCRSFPRVYLDSNHLFPLSFRGGILQVATDDPKASPLELVNSLGASGVKVYLLAPSDLKSLWEYVESLPAPQSAPQPISLADAVPAPVLLADPSLPAAFPSSSLHNAAIDAAIDFAVSPDTTGHNVEKPSIPTPPSALAMQILDGILALAWGEKASLLQLSSYKLPNGSYSSVSLQMRIDGILHAYPTPCDADIWPDLVHALRYILHLPVIDQSNLDTPPFHGFVHQPEIPTAPTSVEQSTAWHWIDGQERRLHGFVASFSMGQYEQQQWTVELLRIPMQLDWSSLGASREMITEYEALHAQKRGITVVAAPSKHGKTSFFYTLLKSIDDNSQNSKKSKTIHTLKSAAYLAPTLPALPFTCVHNSDVEETANTTSTAANPASMIAWYEMGSPYSVVHDGIRTLFLHAAPDIVILDDVDRMGTDATLVIDILRHRESHTYLGLSAQSLSDVLSQLWSLGMSNQTIAASVTGFLLQRRIPQICPHCRRPSDPHQDAAWRFWLHDDGMHDDMQPLSSSSSDGCAQCRYTGCKGYTWWSIYQPMTASIRQQLLQSMGQGAFPSLTVSGSTKEKARNRLRALVASGVITLEDAASVWRSALDANGSGGNTSSNSNSGSGGSSDVVHPLDGADD